MKDKDISKFLSFVLRHKPEEIGITLDENGWTSTSELLLKINTKSFPISIEKLENIVATNTKKRFAFNDDKTKIRANQGHSIEVDLALNEKQPPKYLYHGTVEKFMESIRNKGLIKGSRHHVHLSEDKETANTVGSRRGKPIILTIKSSEMFANKHIFYQSENGVWLTDEVPSEFIKF